MRGPARRGARSRGGARSGPRRLTLVGLAALIVVAGACTTDTVQEGDGEEATEDALDLAAEPAASVILPVDRGEPPERLQTEDLVEGDGAVVGPGDVLVVEYRGWRWSDGGEFASSWGAVEPLRFELGAQEVIPGWEQGILGDEEVGPLRVGSRRVLTIPPELAYGDRGAGAAIGPDETLIFVIDLVAVDTDGEDPDATSPDTGPNTSPDDTGPNGTGEGEQLDG